MKTYSQDNQDIYILEQFFPHKRDGVFVDIGAHDGVTISNSLLFEEIGWSGICVEPLPKIFEQLKQNRKCQCVNGVISNKDVDYVSFCAIDGYAEMLSGIIDAYDPLHKIRILNESAAYGCTRQKIQVQNFKFNELIKFKHIQLLDIDTEGGELEILKSINYELYNIDLILVENNYNNADMRAFLTTKNFEHVIKLGADDLFKHSKVNNHINNNR